MEHPSPNIDFVLSGFVASLVEMAKGRSVRSRPMGGWLTAYGLLGPDGGVVPIEDREGQVMEAAREIGHIDWNPYYKAGIWNDTHQNGRAGRPLIVVGYPETLEFHDGVTELSKAHGKVGFWTTGHLVDRDDRDSWGERRPTDTEFRRADHFWGLAEMRKGTGRTIGLSAEGSMLLSPCKRRIVFAQVRAAAVCEHPMNPGATLEPLQKAAMPVAIRPGMVGAERCGRCRCEPGVCAGVRARPERAQLRSVLEKAIQPIMARGVPRVEAARILARQLRETVHA